MTNKMTQRDYFNEIIALAKGEATKVTADDIIAFAEGRIEALNKKSANKKPTKTQEANEALKVAVLEALEGQDNPLSVSEVIKASEALEGLSTQKVSPLLKALEADGKVVKSADKRRTVYALAK